MKQGNFHNLFFSTENPSEAGFKLHINTRDSEQTFIKLIKFLSL